jgi:serine/threonine protein kinase
VNVTVKLWYVLFLSGELVQPDSNETTLVAVKVLKEGVSNEARDDFEREVEIMSAFDHDNILKLIGTVSTGEFLLLLLFFFLSVPIASQPPSIYGRWKRKLNKIVNNEWFK